MIALACDHAALDMKKDIIALLDEMGLSTRISVHIQRRKLRLSRIRRKGRALVAWANVTAGF